MNALEGVKILDFTHVQSGPTCTQLLAWFGADVIKVERPGVGDATRQQLQDIPDVDSLYFTMLNHNKRSITLDTKNPKGIEVMWRLVKECDVLVENFAPGALARMGLTWEAIHEANPRMILASVKGFGPGAYENCKVYENVAQCVGGAASTTGFRTDIPMVSGAQIGDSGTGLHLALGIVTALYQRTHSGVGQKVDCAMQDGVLNLCRVKLRDQQRLERGPLKEYSQYGEGIGFGDSVPRAGNDSGGGQPGRILKCKGWETDPNAYIYFIAQGAVWEPICDVIGEPTWKTHPDYATPKARLPHLNEIFNPGRSLDDVEDQVRGDGNAQRASRPLRSNPFDEGDRRGRIAEEIRHGGRSRPSGARQVLDRGKPDPAFGEPGRGQALAPVGRAYGRDPARCPRLFRERPPQDLGIRGDRRHP